jgi:hypothetical protein
VRERGKYAEEHFAGEFFGDVGEVGKGDLVLVLHAKSHELGELLLTLHSVQIDLATS